MAQAGHRTICWTPTWYKDREGVGLEHLLLAERAADSVVLAFDEQEGPFRLAYRLYLFENLDGSGFTAELPVDEDGLVLDYPDLFRRVREPG